MMSATSKKAIEIFCSYSQEDRAIFNKLELELQLLEKRGQIAGWHGSKMPQRNERTNAAIPFLNTAHIILLLISSSYLGSDDLWDIEMMPAVKRHQAGEARLIPVILRYVDIIQAPFSKLYSLPKNGIPVDSWSNLDDAISDVMKGIQMVIKELTA